MNIAKMKAAGVLGIVTGIILLLVGIFNFRNPATHTYWDFVFIILGALDIFINVSIANDASRRAKR